MSVDTMTPTVAARGPVLVFGGPYSNLQATAAALGEARRRGIAPDHVVYTGDVVAYGADPAETVALIRDAGIHVVMGNCEEQLAASRPDCGCGFVVGSACDVAAGAWYAHADRELGSDDRAWMARLPRRIDLSLNGLTLAVVHGTLTAINRFVFASTAERVKAPDLAASGTDGIVAGHSGLPFTQAIGGSLWHNPGAVGMPANDGTPRVWLSVLLPGPEPRSLDIEHAALAYDHDEAARRMREAGLPGGYADALGTGLWPPSDVLPPAEQSVRGRPLDPGRVTWRPDASRADPPSWPPLQV